VTSQVVVTGATLEYGGASFPANGYPFGLGAILIRVTGTAVPTGSLVASQEILNAGAGNGHELRIEDVEVEPAAGQADPALPGPVEFSVRFASAVTDFSASSLALGGSANPTGATISGAGQDYTVAVDGMDRPGTVTLAVVAGGAHDAGGHACLASFSRGHGVTVTGARPSVVIAHAAGQSDPTSDATVVFTATFSSDVSGFTAAGIQLGGSAAPDSAIVTGGGSVYTIAVSGMTGSGTVTATIVDGAARDVATGFSSPASATASVEYARGDGPTGCGLGGTGVLIAAGLALAARRRRA
jgi:hypothetical protein